MARRTVALATLFILTLFAGAAAAQSYTTGSMSANTTNPGPGDPVHLSGTGCPSNSGVDFAIDHDTNAAGGTTADSRGNFQGDVNAPQQPGPHEIEATCGTQVLALEIEVRGGGTAASPLPRTGSNSTFPMTTVAVALLAVGGLFVLAARRRRPAHVDA